MKVIVHNLSLSAWIGLFCLVVSSARSNENSQPQAPSTVSSPLVSTNEARELSRALGTIYGGATSMEGFEVDTGSFVEAFKESYHLPTEKRARAITEAREKVAKAREEMARKLAAKRAEIAVANRTKAAQFLEENKKKSGVKTLPSGLQYRVLQEGTGRKPTTNDIVTADYDAVAFDGKPYQSTYKRKVPQRWWLDRTFVLPGIREALLLMNQGDEWEITLPVDLAYGPEGAGDDLEPEAPLIFKLKLNNIKPVAEQLGEMYQTFSRGNRQTAESFLEQNKQKPDIKELPDNLQYQVLVEGTGEKLANGKFFEIRCRLTTIDGTEIGRIPAPGFPAFYDLEQARKHLIPGVGRALAMMDAGSKWKLFIPPDLAFGEDQFTNLGPGSLVIAELEVISPIVLGKD